MIRHLLMAALTALPSAPALAASAACTPDPAAFRALRERVLHPPAGQVIAVAHRACFAAAPENTPLAIEHCWRLGVEVVENDVRSTKDGELVVVHDDTVDRVTDSWGYVDDLTAADLARMHMREREGGRDAFMTAQPVPTLRAYFRAAKNRVMINLELKSSSSASWETLFEKSIRIAREEGVLDHLLLKIPDVRNHGKTSKRHLLETTGMPAGVTLMPIIWQSDTPLGARLDELERFGAVGYEMPFSDPAYLGQVRKEPRLAGRPVMAVAVQPYWSGGLDDALSMPDPDAGWGKLIALGANYVMTDRPEALIDYLEHKGMRPPAAPRCAQ
jgi:glycerophosphoryl diester phosphodiesterase